MRNEQLSALRKKSKKVKSRLTSKCLRHEVAIAKEKEVTSPNKTKLQKLSVELERNLQSGYDTIVKILEALEKILDNRKEADLHIVRLLKFIPSIMEILKRVSLVHKNDTQDFMRVLDVSTKILSKFCLMFENRNYLILTNRLVDLIELLLWCFSRPTSYIYSLDFVPELFYVLTSLIKFKCSREFGAIKDDLINYIFLSGFLPKIKVKFMSFHEV